MAKSNAFPFREFTHSILSTSDFMDWLLRLNLHDPIAPEIMAKDIRSLPRSLKYVEAADLLRSVDNLEGVGSSSTSDSSSFAIVGTKRLGEQWLASAVASALGIKVLHEVVPTSDPTLSNARISLTPFGDSLRSIKPADLVDEQGSWMVHETTSVRSRLAEAICRADLQDQAWQAVLILLDLPRRGKRSIVVDIKVGDAPPSQPYRKAMEMAFSLLKVSGLSGIPCRVILTDVNSTSSSAFGALGEVEELARALCGTRAPQYLTSAIKLVINALDLQRHHIDIESAETTAYETIHVGSAKAIALTWGVPQLNLAITGNSAEYHSYAYHAEISGYLSQINAAALDTALAEIEVNVSPDSMSRAYGLVLPRLGDYVAMGERLIDVGASSPLKPVADLDCLLRNVCALSRERSSPVASVRATLMPESVAIKREVVTVAPVRWIGNGQLQVYVKRVGEGIDFFSLPYDINSGNIDKSRLASQLVEDALPAMTVAQPSQIAVVRSDELAYDATLDAVLSLRYYVFVVPVFASGETVSSSTINLNSKNWISIEDIGSYAPRVMGHALRATWESLASWCVDQSKTV